MPDLKDETAEEARRFVGQLVSDSREMEPKIAHILNEHFAQLVEPIGQTFDGGPDIVPAQEHEKVNR